MATQVFSVSLVDEANSVDHIVLFPIMLSYALPMAPCSITFLLSWHCSMSKTANYWPFIKTFKKHIHMNNIRFSWCCFDSLKGIMCIIWNHGQVDHFPNADGRRNRCIITSVARTSSLLLGFCLKSRQQAEKEHSEIVWLLEYLLQKGKHEHKGPIDFLEFVVDIEICIMNGSSSHQTPFFAHKKSGEVLENSSSPNLRSQGHESLGRASQTSSWRCWYCQPEALKLLCFHAFSTWHQQIDTICFYKYFPGRSYNIRSILAQVMFVSRHIIIFAFTYTGDIHLLRLWHMGSVYRHAVVVRTLAVLQVTRLLLQLAFGRGFPWVRPCRRRGVASGCFLVALGFLTLQEWCQTISGLTDLLLEFRQVLSHINLA